MMSPFSSTAIPCLIGVLLIIGNVSGVHLSIGGITLNAIGGTATADLVMDAAPADGFSGYIIQLDIADPSVANITAVTYNPALSGMTDTSTLPFNSGHIGWVDVNEVLQAPGGETNLTLATLTFCGLSGGSTTLNTALVLVNDDDGDNMIPQMTIDTPSISVAPATSSGSSGSSSSGFTSSGIRTSVAATGTGTVTTLVTATAHITTLPTATMTVTRTPPPEKVADSDTSAPPTTYATPATTHATPAPTTGSCIGTVIGAICGAACGSLFIIRNRKS